MQHLGHCVLLLVIVLLSNTSKGNAPESLHHPNNNEQYDNTTHFSNSLRNKSVQTLREASRENSNGNNSWEETSTTNTGREELDEKEDDEFAQRKITENRDGQARAYKMEIFVTPIRYENGVFFTAEPRDNTTKSKKDYIQLCCPLDHRLSIEEWKCLVDRTVTFPFAHREKMHKGAYRLRNVLPFKSLPPCSGTHRHIIIDPSFPGNVYTFLDDATAHFPGGHCLSSSRYCLAAVSNQTGFELIFCGTRRDISWTYVLVAIIVSLIFLLLTFMVYSILREFRNMHGYTLRAYIASVFVSNAMYVVYLQLNKITYSSCVLLGFIFNFAMYSTFLWLNVTCFDLWWTFR